VVVVVGGRVVDVVVVGGRVVVVVLAGGSPPGRGGSVVAGAAGSATTESNAGGSGCMATIGVTLKDPLGERANAADAGWFEATPGTWFGAAVVLVVLSGSAGGAVVLLTCSMAVRPTPDADEKPHTTRARNSTVAPTTPAT
jgi:hypothetical protein